MAPENRKLIGDYCKNTNIVFHQSFLIRNELDENNYPGKLRFTDLTDKDFLTYEEPFPIILNQLSVVDIEEYNMDIDPLNVSSLGKIPYYRGNENLVNASIADL